MCQCSLWEVYSTKCSDKVFMCDQDHDPKSLGDMITLALTYLVFTDRSQDQQSVIAVPNGPYWRFPLPRGYKCSVYCVLRTPIQCSSMLGRCPLARGYKCASVVNCKRDHHLFFFRWKGPAWSSFEGVGRAYYLTLDMKCHSHCDLIPNFT